MKLLLIFILLAALTNAIVLDKALGMLSPEELKRRARAAHDRKAAQVYKMAAYGPSLQVMLWLKAVFATGLLFIVLAPLSWPLVLILFILLGWLVRAWRPKISTDGWVWGWASSVSGVIAWAMEGLNPVLSRLSSSWQPQPTPHHVYEKEDLLELINGQTAQPGNRIPETDLRLAFNSISFGDKKIAQFMLPLARAKLVGENEEIGPLLMDDLHQSGATRFAVIRAGSAKKPEIIGTLSLKNLLEQTGKGKVASVMAKKVCFVNESGTLRQALDAFLKTHQHLFIVVDDFEEQTGLISIEDVLAQILGKDIADEFDNYEDLHAVAAKETNPGSQNHNDQAVAPDEK